MLLGWVRPLLNVLGPRNRRANVVNGRAHVELRPIPGEQSAPFAARLREALSRREGVQWLDVNPVVGRVVVAFDAEVCELRDIVAQIERVEDELGLADVPFCLDRPEHPGDLEPLLRCLLELGGDFLGLGMAFVGRAARLPTLPIEIDALAVLSLFDAPRLRAVLDERLGRQTTNLALTLGNAMAQGLAQSPLGPVVDIAYRTLVVSERWTRRRVWSERETALCGAPSAPAADDPVLPRPTPLPPGPIENYADAALFASVGAFSVGVATTGDIANSTAPLLGGLPKPARLGREAFAAYLARALALRGILSLDPEVLRRLDRVDCVVLERDLLVDGAGVHARLDPDAEVLLRSARRSGMQIVVAAHAGAYLPGAGMDVVVTGRRPLAGEVRRLQREGHVVCVVASGPTPALAAADCGIGLVRPGAPPPWGAHILCGETLDDARFILDACAAAREAAQQSVMLAAAGAGVGLLISFGGLSRDTPGRVMTAVNLATLVAMANGVRLSAFLALEPAPVRRDATPWHSLELTGVLTRLGTSLEGLSGVEALRRHLPAPQAPSALARLGTAVVDQLRNPLTPILTVGAGLSAAVGSVADAALVVGVLGLNALIGGVQHVRTDRAIAGLGENDRQRARVRRDGQEISVDPADLVPGDVLVLRGGDLIPADCRIAEAAGLEVDESSLTGESLPVAKSAAPSDAALVAERSSMLYQGTAVAGGSAAAVVVAVGEATEARLAALAAEERKPRSGVEERLEALTELTAPIAVLGGAALAATGLLRGRPGSEVLASGVSLAVAAVPEGLPLLAMVAQLGAARRLSARGVLVRNPRAIEALGRVEVVCVDKTGTLTEGRIRLRSVWDAAGTHDVARLDPHARRVLGAGLRASPAVVEGQRLAHPTDRALVDGAGQAGVAVGESAPRWHRLAELPFEPTRGFHAVLGRCGETLLLSVKGAPEVVLPRCWEWGGSDGVRPLDPHVQARLGEEASRLARQGLRVLAVAERPLVLDATFDDGTVNGLAFLGFLAFSDPVRASAAEAVRALEGAGVSVLMVTGDHPSTAERIAAELGLLDGNGVLTGAELDELDDETLDAALGKTRVFARVTPGHKVRIVGALQRSGRTVAMTGDGANDAPAIRLAHCGIALGQRAASAARDAADLVVVDDRIETIVDAVLEGRAMWASVRDAVAVLVGGNLGEIGFTVGAGMLGGGSPLNARQLLLVNLLTDVAPAMAIALRPPTRRRPAELLHEGPEASLGKALDRDIAWRALVTAAGAGGAWLAARPAGSAARASTVALVSLVGTQLGQTLVAGGRSPLVLAAGLGSLAALGAIVQTPGLSQFFGCTPLGPVAWTTAATATGIATGASVLVPRLVPALGPWLEDAVNSARASDTVQPARAWLDWLLGFPAPASA